MNQRRRRDGRRLRRTKLKSSLQTHWKTFRLVYERGTGAKIEPKMNRQMHQVCHPQLPAPHRHFFIALPRRPSAPVPGNPLQRRDDADRAGQILRRLARQHHLSDEKRPKAPLDIVDVRLLLFTNLTTVGVRYKTGRYRIQNGLICQAAFITANRPGAIFHLQYKHIRVSLLRDPLGGPHRILLEWTFEFTKSYLGAKDG